MPDYLRHVFLVLTIFVVVGYSNCGVVNQAPKSDTEKILTLNGTVTGNPFSKTFSLYRGVGLATEVFADGICKYIERCGRSTYDQCRLKLDSLKGLGPKITKSLENLDPNLTFAELADLEYQDQLLGDLQRATEIFNRYQAPRFRQGTYSYTTQLCEFTTGGISLKFFDDLAVKNPNFFILYPLEESVLFAERGTYGLWVEKGIQGHGLSVVSPAGTARVELNESFLLKGYSFYKLSFLRKKIAGNPNISASFRVTVDGQSTYQFKTFYELPTEWSDVSRFEHIFTTPMTNEPVYVSVGLRVFSDHYVKVDLDTLEFKDLFNNVILNNNSDFETNPFLDFQVLY